MKVICCYVSQEETSAKALAAFAPNAELVDTSGSIYAYNDAIASRWDGTEDLVVIEGDKEITADVLPSFRDCSELWCSYSYFVYPAVIKQEVNIGLGCTRYSARLQRIVQPADFLVRDEPFFGPPCVDCSGIGCWRNLDARIAWAIRSHGTSEGGIKVHVHGRVNHHHDYSNHVLSNWNKTFEQQKSKFLSASDMNAVDKELAGPDWNRFS